jgi:general secretion pathway protein G
MNKNVKKRRGFTLLELMIVIVILGLLSALVLPNILGKAEGAKKQLVCIQMKNIKESLKSFKFDNGIYPTTEEGLMALIKNPDAEKYKNYAPKAYLDSKNVPIDPWNNEYIYLNEDSIDIISLGSDGRDGGEEEAQDIHLNECER